MSDIKTLKAPCKACPWKVQSRASDIPNFEMELAENLAKTCPDNRGMGPDVGASFFQCHQSDDKNEMACAGWLASVGHRHPGIRIAVWANQLSPATLSPSKNWPELHANYQEVLQKLRSTLDPVQE